MVQLCCSDMLALCTVGGGLLRLGPGTLFAQSSFSSPFYARFTSIMHAHSEVIMLIHLE